MLWSLGDKIVPRLDGGQVGQSGDLTLAECMLSDKRRALHINREGNNSVRNWREGMASILCSTNEGMAN